MTVVSLTAAKTPPFFSRKQKERSKIDLKALDLCGLAEISEIFSCAGGFSFMSSHWTRRAWCVRSFSLISSAKCVKASDVVADQCGPALPPPTSLLLSNCTLFVLGALTWPIHSRCRLRGGSVPYPLGNRVTICSPCSRQRC